MKFSLIVATVGRAYQLKLLLESLEAQTYKNFEVILVDQNPLGFLSDFLTSIHVSFPIMHLRSDVGLSAARNVGLLYVTGQVVAFPDDDCWYPPDLLDAVSNLLRDHPEWDGLTGKLVDPEDADAFPFYFKTSGAVDITNVWHRSTSVSIFLHRTVVEAVGIFDTRLGRGASTGMLAAEESDYLIRAMRLGYSLYNCSNVCIYHRDVPYERRIALAFGEGRAFGYVLRIYSYPIRFVVGTWVRPLGGMALSLLYGNWPKVQYYLASFRGRLRGWLIDSRTGRFLAQDTEGANLRQRVCLSEPKKIPGRVR